MSLEKLKEPLDISYIDFRVQSINKGKYATILAYKDARVDMKVLDEAVGCLNWKREHLNNNANCVVSIWDSENKHWVSKEDTGSESMAEAKKGLASDSFKRACFNWGIGRELYDYPVISVKLKDTECSEYNGKMKASFGLKLKEWKWDIEFKDGGVSKLEAKDELGNIRFTFPSGKTKPKSKTPKKAVKEKLTADGLKFLTDRGTIKQINEAFDIRDVSAAQKVLLDKKLKELQNV